MIDWLIVTDNENDITHSRIRHTGLDRLQVQEQLGGGAVLQHLHHLLQHRQVHSLDHLHRRLHFPHFVQDLITFRPWALLVYVPSVRSHLLVDISDVAGNSYKSQSRCSNWFCKVTWRSHGTFVAQCHSSENHPRHQQLHLIHWEISLTSINAIW